MGSMLKRLLLAILLAGCAPSVDYVIEGTAQRVDITYENGSGNAEQLSDVPLPWEYSFDGASGDFLYISAQNQGETGSVTCNIYVNGVLEETSTSSGRFVISTASGSI